MTTDSTQTITTIAAQLLAGMLANPHLYATISDEEGRGPQEQILISNAILMAERLIEKAQSLEHTQP